MPAGPTQTQALFSPAASSAAPSTVQAEPAASPMAATSIPSPAAGSSTPAGSNPKVPDFSHVVEIILENHEYGFVAGNTRQMPFFNQMADKYTLLTQYYAVAHPSLPNYIAMIAGSTLGIHTDCSTCYVDAPNLADLIEASHRTWKTYQEDMPSPCFQGTTNLYAQRHDPFIYFDNIRTNQQRCDGNVVPLSALDGDLAGSGLPDFAFITPNVCNDAHDCDLSVADKWLSDMVSKIMNSKSYDSHTLIVITFDEGQGDHSCCGLGPVAGGQVATLLISPLVKSGFQDSTPYSHYSVLKTIAVAWGLTQLGHAADAETNLIVAPWK